MLPVYLTAQGFARIRKDSQGFARIRKDSLSSLRTFTIRGGRAPVIDMGDRSQMYGQGSAREHALGERHVPERDRAKPGQMEIGDDLGAGDVIHVAVEASEVVGDEEVGPFAFDGRLDKCRQLWLSARQLPIAEVFLDEPGYSQ